MKMKRVFFISIYSHKSIKITDVYYNTEKYCNTYHNSVFSTAKKYIEEQGIKLTGYSQDENNGYVFISNDFTDILR